MFNLRREKACRDFGEPNVHIIVCIGENKAMKKPKMEKIRRNFIPTQYAAFSTCFTYFTCFATIRTQ